jgi:hypothetical protein
MPSPKVPRLLECKSCKHEWRDREPTVCPKCKSVDVLSRCGRKFKSGRECRNKSAFGQARCKRCGARSQARASAASAGRTSLWHNRTYADAVLRAASDPSLRDLTHDHAAIQQLLDEAIGKASAGEGGGLAWRKLEKLVGALERDAEDNPAAIAGHVGKLKALILEERIRSSALLDVDMLSHRRTENLKAEAQIAQAARAVIPIQDVQIMIMVLVAAVRDIVAPVSADLAAAVGRRIALVAPGTNTVAGVELGVQDGN